MSKDASRLLKAAVGKGQLTQVGHRAGHPSYLPSSPVPVRLASCSSCHDASCLQVETVLRDVYNALPANGENGDLDGEEAAGLGDDGLQAEFRVSPKGCTVRHPISEQGHRPTRTHDQCPDHAPLLPGSARSRRTSSTSPPRWCVTHPSMRPACRLLLLACPAHDD